MRPVTARRSGPSRAPRSRRLALSFALRWTPAAALVASPRTRLHRTAFACERVPTAASPSRSLRWGLALAPVAPRTSQSRPRLSRIAARSRVVQVTNLRRRPLPRAVVPTLAVPRLSPQLFLRPSLVALALSLEKTTVSRTPAPRNAPVLAALRTSHPKPHPSRTVLRPAAPLRSLPSSLPLVTVAQTFVVHSPSPMKPPS